MENLEDIVRNVYRNLDYLNLKIGIGKLMREYEVKISLPEDIEIQYYLLNSKLKSSYSGRIKVPEEIRQNGIGRKLVENRELICKDLGFNYIFINNNENPNFWDYMGYDNMDEEMIQYYDKCIPSFYDFDSDFKVPMFKLLL